MYKRQDLSTSLFGIKLKTPIIQAPVAAQGLAHEEGEVATAKAMAEVGSIFSISTYGSTSVEDAAKAAPDLSLIHIFIALFHTGWFVESMWTQTLVIHMIRTPKIPFLQSRASAPLTILTFMGIIGLTIIPFTSFGHSIGLMALPINFFPWLILTVVIDVYKRQDYGNTRRTY